MNRGLIGYLQDDDYFDVKIALMKKSKTTLASLFAAFPGYRNLLPDQNIEINFIYSDSRKVQRGDLFVAFEGESSDGHDFITNAVDAGAAAIVGDKQLDYEIPVPYILVENSRKILAHLAAAYYGHPSRRMVLIGVTGTDGKTTTSNMIYWILKYSGYNVGLISTVNAVIGDEILDTGFHVTTPDAMDVQAILARMLELGITHVILETTSHGWAQYRVDACEFDIGVVTNITHEHLDYHKTYENYLSAKARLLLSLAHTIKKPFPVKRVAVLNRDDRSFEYLQKYVTTGQISYGSTDTGAFSFSDLEYSEKGITFSLRHLGHNKKLQLPIFGDYNVYNSLAAVACVVEGLDIPISKAIEALKDFPGIPGRMELIDLGQNFLAFVDFAHTPNALKAALETGRKIIDSRGISEEKSGSKLIAVFGSAGLRDRQKRRMMAEVSADLADITILTAEDPRTESLDAILTEMVNAAITRGAIMDKTVFSEPDRPESLHKAVMMAKKGDVVIACGKGHEQSMCFGTIEYPWDDRIALKSAIADRLGIPSDQPMPILPTSKERYEKS